MSDHRIRTTDQGAPLSPRRAFLRRLLGLAGGAALLGGCSSGGTIPVPTPGPTPTPGPDPSPSPGGGTGGGGGAGPGDWDFAPLAGGFAANYAVADAAGGGSLPLTLRSVRGFSAPIALTVVSVAAREVITGADVAATGVTARLDPATLASLPAGDTPVVLEALGLGSLPPATRVTVEFRAEGGGLTRFLLDGITNRNTCRFYSRGVALPAEFTVTLRPGTNSYPLGVSVAAVGVAGRLELRFEGLPPGFSAAPESVAVTGLPDGAGDPFAFVNLTLQRTGAVAAGLYPVRLVATVDGAVVRDQSVSLAVQEQAAPPNQPQLTVRTEGALTVARGQSLRVPTRLTITERDLTLALSAKTLPPGVSVAFDDPTVSLAVGQPRDTAITFTASGAAATGPQEAVLEAVSGELVYAIRLTLTVT